MQPRIVEESVGLEPESNDNRNGNNQWKDKNAPVNRKSGELIRFAQLSRDAAANIEREKILREMSLKINQSQEAERLQTTLRLHSVIVRSLDLTNPVRKSSVELPTAAANGAADVKTGCEMGNAPVVSDQSTRPGKLSPMSIGPFRRPSFRYRA